MQRYRGKVAYFGRDLAGWQRQANTEETVQAWMEKVLGKITGEEVRIVGAGRTDAGVHALEQVFHFDLRSPRSAFSLLGGINGNIRKEIAVLSLEKASSEFHALRDAREKFYRYRVLNRKMRCPFREGMVYFFPEELKLEKMEKAAGFLRGKYDFSSFCASGAGAKTRVRELKKLDIYAQKDEVIFDFQAPGFLYKMVRNITGTLLEVGRGKIEAERVEEIREAKDRRSAGPTSPAHGLALVEIIY